MKRPANWQVSSCRSCPDPTDPNVFVSFYSPSSDELLMVEHLVDKPRGQPVRQWLDDVKAKAKLNPRISEEWITFAGEPALKVFTRNADSTQSEVVYVVGSSSPIFHEMITTLRFTGSQAAPPIHR
jgi:hypothetical protein